MSQLYDDYWRRMELREEFLNIGRIPVKRWYASEGLNDIERVYFDELAGSDSILEVGSGRNNLREKFFRSGYDGLYRTMDLSREFPHDYHALADVEGIYDAIVILEVIEHMGLEQFWDLLEFIGAHLAPHGKLVISTTQPGSVIPWESWDMTHVQHYPFHDLYALFRARGFSVRCFRVWTRSHRETLRQGGRMLLRRMLCYVLGIDYADTIALVMQRGPAPAAGT